MTGAGCRVIAYSGRVISRLSHRSGTRTALAVLALSTCLLLPGAALAGEEKQSLPDPNPSAQPRSDSQSGSPKASNMPNTGVSIPLLVAAGVGLLAAGAAVRPIQRRRRAYRSDVWLAAVRTGSSPGSD